MLHIWHFILFEQMDSTVKQEKSPKCNRVLVSFSVCFALISSIILILLVIRYFPNDGPNVYKIVQTKDGGIRGRRFETAYRKRPYFAFRGIRYGKPPVGDLRFKVCTFLATPASGRMGALNAYVIWILGSRTSGIMGTRNN